MATPRLTNRELDVMSILWKHGPSTVAGVREKLPVELAYTSVLSVLQDLEAKGWVSHEALGRAYLYRPTVAPEEAGRGALGRLLDKVFDGSAELLLTRLVEDRSLSKDELARMRRILEQEIAKSEKRPRGGKR